MSELKKRDFYKTLLVSQTGKGKTYSARNLNPKTTGFINVENKPLSFKNNFTYEKRCNNYTEAKEALIDFAKNPDIDVIFFDSLSAYFEMLVFECRKTKKGFDVWNMYNEEVGILLNLIKRIPKEIYVTAHYEILGIEGSQEKRVKSKGKEWEGVIEKEFTIVLYGDNKFQDNGRPEYYFNLVQEGTSSKCPPDIFGEEVFKIPNDCAYIQDHILKFVG